MTATLTGVVLTGGSWSVWFSCLDVGADASKVAAPEHPRLIGCSDDPQHLTPLLNDLAVSVAAPAILLSDPDGQVRLGGVRGWFVDDVRLLDELTVSVLGSDLELVGSDVSGADRQSYTYVARRLGGWLHNPQVTLDRRRTLTPAGLVEEIEVASRGPEDVALTLYVDLVSDLAPMARCARATTPRASRGTARPTVSPGVATTPASGWPSTRPRRTSSEGRRVTWTATVAPGGSFTVRLTFEADGTPALGPGGPAPWGAVAVEAPDTRLPRLVRQSVADLAAC